MSDLHLRWFDRAVAIAVVVAVSAALLAGAAELALLAVVVGVGVMGVAATLSPARHALAPPPSSGDPPRRVLVVDVSERDTAVGDDHDDR